MLDSRPNKTLETLSCSVQSIDHVPDSVCSECGKVIVSGAVVWHGRELCARCGDFYSHWPDGESENKEGECPTN
jgi:hypothetical protein